MSTLWFARRASFVLSIEVSAAWYQWTSDRLRMQNLTNVEVRLRPEEEMYTAAATPADGLFDLVLIDGDWRARCVEPALRALGAGGYLYIDNTDVDGRDAVRILRSTLPALELSYYTDFTPGAAFPTTGVSAHIQGVR
jgi:predicted O-methyltransferase YrrM